MLMLQNRRCPYRLGRVECVGDVHSDPWHGRKPFAPGLPRRGASVPRPVKGGLDLDLAAGKTQRLVKRFACAEGVGGTRRKKGNQDAIHLRTV